MKIRKTHVSLTQRIFVLARRAHQPQTHKKKLWMLFSWIIQISILQQHEQQNGLSTAHIHTLTNHATSAAERDAVNFSKNQLSHATSWQPRKNSALLVFARCSPITHLHVLESIQRLLHKNGNGFAWMRTCKCKLISGKSRLRCRNKIELHTFRTQKKSFWI